MRLRQLAAHVGRENDGGVESSPHVAAAERQTQQAAQPVRFGADADTVALYRFDEGCGNECHEATGDPELMLRAHKQALWSYVEGLGPVIRFERSDDDANVLVGPVNHDALELRRCPNEHTVEAWVRYTGPWGAEVGGEHPRTTAQICGTDDDGFSLPSGQRTGWSFSLHDGVRDDDPQDGHLMPHARNLGQTGHLDFSGLTGLDGTRGPFYCGLADPAAVSRSGLEGEGWHHIAWQWRKHDESHWLFVDGKLIWSARAPETRVVGPVQGNTIPFMVGGVVHSQDPPFYIGWCSFQGEMASLRISKVMRLPVANSLRIVPQYGRVHIIERGGPATQDQRAVARAHPASLRDGLLGAEYSEILKIEGGDARSFALSLGSLPRGLQFDELRGIVRGVPIEPGTALFAVTAFGTNGQKSQPQRFTLCVVEPRIATQSLPVAFCGQAYFAPLDAGNLMQPVHWRAVVELPAWLSLEVVEHGDQTCLRGTAPDSVVGTATALVALEATAGGIGVKIELILRVLPKHLQEFKVDEHTQALWDWQGDDGKCFADRAGRAGDDSLTLSWVNMAGDTRENFPGWGLYPWECGGGEWGFTTPGEAGPIADLRTCTEAWCVEAWFRVGDDQIATDRYGRPFAFGHICGSFDSSESGVWELFLHTHGSADGSLAPGVTFNSNSHRWEALGPWKYPEGIVQTVDDCRVIDTEWHHVAWQFAFETQTHELWLDGMLIWRLAYPDGMDLANDRIGHGAQFSVSTRPNGYTRYGGAFNFLGYGHWFGNIGEVRISDVVRYALVT